ncbi:TPA: restriction endonuclease subunit S [Staphylococcus aureus]|nr:restriction endonuclease subunit S [Staphylococcus aureus]
MKPELRFPEFKDEWEKKKLGNLSSQSLYGIGASAVEFDKKNVYVRITDIDGDTRRIIGDYTSPDTIDKKYLLEKNDILFARTGASTGKTYIHSKFDKTLKYYFAGFLIKFKIKDNYSPKFIYQYTFTEMYRNWVKVMSMRSGQPGINSEEYSNLSLCTPSKNEQEKIGNFFSKLDRQIELEEQKLAKLEEQKKGYMQKIFSQELRFKDENGNTFEEWKNTNFNYFMSEPDNLEKGIDLRKDQLLTVKLEGNGISKANINRALKMGSTVYYKRFAGQFIYGKQNFFNGAFGIVPKFLNNYYSSGDVPALNIDYSKIDSKYFINYISRKDYYKKKEAFSTGTGSKRIHEKTLLDFDIMLPSVEEQEKIGDFFNDLDELIEKQSSKIGVLKQRKKGFLQKMFV